MRDLACNFRARTAPMVRWRMGLQIWLGEGGALPVVPRASPGEAAQLVALRVRSAARGKARTSPGEAARPHI